MCGRYTLTRSDPESLAEALPFDEINDTRIQLEPRYNIAPGQRSPVAYAVGEGGVLVEATWGFERPAGGITINARSETAARKAMFRRAFAEGRCLVPADGFFEWRAEGGIKQPYLFQRTDHGVFVMAGLVEEGRYVVLTRGAEGAVASIHDRMPVILDRDGATRWLEEGAIGDAPALQRRAVSTRVNRIDHDDPVCLEEIAQESFGF